MELRIILFQFVMGLRDRNLLLSVLNTTATKREAKQYINKYSAQSKLKRVCLVRISGFDINRTLGSDHGPNLGRTLAYLRGLGAYPLVLFDGQPLINSYLSNKSAHLRNYEELLWTHCLQLNKHINRKHQGTMTLSSAFETNTKGLSVNTKWIYEAFNIKRIPLLMPLMYDQDTNEMKLLNSAKATKAICAALNSNYVVDKLVFLDWVGGLPSIRRHNAAHVLVNLKQEYGSVSTELRTNTNLDPQIVQRHLENLETMKQSLEVCDNEATGLITDPKAAGVAFGMNPILHNILTDRPLISPSLPLDLESTQLRTSVVQSGFPVYTRHSVTGLDLAREAKVGNINLISLKRLLDESFKRSINLDHYLARIRDCVAAIIIVGDYEGCAIITYEYVDGKRVTYLDKLAVSPHAQGAKGVADIMLIQMVRRLFPKELVWRSRKDNVVNSWYFRRSRGHLLLENCNWTMFWINDDPHPPLDVYERVCRSIEPSFDS